jgi:hypothetical protein
MSRPGRYSDVQRRNRIEMSQMGQDDPDCDTDGTVPARKKPKKEVKREIIPAGVDIYPFATEFVNWACALGGWWAILGMVTVAAGVIFWLIFLRPIPIIPPAVLRYGMIQYILLFPLYLFNFILFRVSKMVEFYQLGLIVNALGLADEIWLTFVIIYNFYACSFGVYPSSCTGNYTIDFIVFWPTLILLLVGFASVAKILTVIAHAGHTTPLYYRLINH